MNTQELLRHVDHTLLKATATWGEIVDLCNQAVHLSTASVCVPPSYVERIKKAYGEKLTICTVIGFPLGYATTAAKAAEARDAVENGADELDMVVNLGDVKDGAFDRVTEEIRTLKQIAGQRVLKVIVETCYLTQEEKIALCRCVSDGGADFIKTSTGFGSAGAALEDIVLFKEHIAPGVRIKAAGGIRTKEAMEAYLTAGCDRIGTSGAAKMAEAQNR